MSPSDEQKQAARAAIAAALRPLIDPENVNYEEDTFGPFEHVRDVVRGALADIEADGLGGCRLCAS